MINQRGERNMSDFFEIDFIEAGEKSSGDAICLRYRVNGHIYIHVVDGGYTSDGAKIVDHVHRHYNEKRFIDHVVLTHPDGDHASGLRTVLENFDVGSLWMNRPWKHLKELMPRFNYNYTEKGLRQRLRKDFPHTADLEDIALNRGMEIKDAFQGARIGEFVVLAPTRDRYLDLVVESEKTPEPERKASIEGAAYERVIAAVRSILAVWGQENLKGDTDGTSNENESSTIQYAKLCGERILLTGDSGVRALDEAYRRAIRVGVELPGIDRFHVPHHGSRRNVSSEILDNWLGPKLSEGSPGGKFTAIISANRSDEEHPRKAVVRALIHRGGKVVQTNGITRSHKNGPDRGWSAATPLTYPTDMEE